MLPNELSELNAQIHSFLRDLSPFLLKPEALDCLEYLVRKYRVNIYNVHSVLYCCLPYHRADAFRRIIGILYVRGTRWAWVEGLQKTDSAFDRKLFTKQCVRNQTFLNFVLQANKDSAEDKNASASLVSFLFFVVSEYVGFQTDISEELLVKILSYCVFPGIKSKNKDSQAAALLVACQLSVKVALSADLVSVLVEEICRARLDGDLQPNALQVLASLCACRGKDAAVEFSSKAVRSLARLPDFAANLAKLGCGPRALPLWRALLPSLFKCCGEHEQVASAAQSIAERVDFGKHLHLVVRALLSRMKKVTKDVEAASRARHLAEEHPYVGEMMRALDAKYGDAFDVVLNAAVKSKEYRNIEKELAEYLGEVFSGTLRQPIGNESTTLQAAVDSPHPEVRKNALIRLLELWGKGGVPLEFIHGALLRRIHDEEESISEIAFRREELLQVSPSALVSECGDIVKDFFACPEDSPHRKQKHSKAKAAIGFLLGKFAERHGPSELGPVLPLVLPALLMGRGRGTRKLAHASLKAASSCEAELFCKTQSKKKALKQFEKRAKGKAAAMEDDKEFEDLAVNQSTVANLAEAVCKMTPETISDLLPQLLREEFSEREGLLVLYSALHLMAAKGKKRDTLCSVGWDYVKRNWAKIGRSSLPRPEGGESWGNGVPPLDHLRLFYSNADAAHLQLLERTLHLLLQGVSLTMGDYQGILTSVLQIDPPAKSVVYTDVALARLCGDASASGGGAGQRKVTREGILMEVYYSCKDRLDKEAVKRVRARILRSLSGHLSSTNSVITKRMEDQAVAKKRHAHKQMNGNGAGALNGLGDAANIDIQLCIPWLLSALCEGNEGVRKDALGILNLLSNIVKSGALKDAADLSVNLQSLTEFISDTLVKSSVGLMTGHVTLASTLEAFCGKAKASKQDKDGMLPFLLEASVRYPYKEIAVHLTGSLGRVGPPARRIEALSKLLRKELDKYIDASFGFANDARITEEDISLLSNILKGFRVTSSSEVVVSDWFDSFVACMHFPSKHEFSWEVRKSAIDTLSDDFFALLPEDKKSLLVHSLAYLTYKDDSEIVRSVASEKLSGIQKDAKVVEPALMGLINGCRAASKPKGSAGAPKRSKKTAAGEVENRFKWVKEVLEDKESLGLNPTLLALEALDLTEFDNMASLLDGLLATLELLIHLQRATEEEGSDAQRVGASDLESTARFAAKAFLHREIDVVSQARYGIELGLQALYNISATAKTKAARVGVLGLTLKCLQLTEQPSIHEYALDIMDQVVGGLSKRELESQASAVFGAVMDALRLHTKWRASNQKFFSGVLAVLRPFLSSAKTKGAMLTEVSNKVADFSRSDQELFFALTRQVWGEQDLLGDLLVKAFKRGGEESRDLAGLICEGYSGSRCLEAFRELLSEGSGDSMDDKLGFVAEVIASNASQYAASEGGPKEAMLRLSVDQMAGASGETLGLCENLVVALEAICTTEEFVVPLAGLCESKDDAIVRASLKLLSEKLYGMRGKLRHDAGAAVFDALSGVLGRSRATEDARGSSLGVLEQGLRHFKDSNVASLVDRLLEEEAAVGQQAAAVARFLGSAVASLKSKAIPCLPKVAGRILDTLRSAESNTATQAGLHAFESLVSHHGGMMGPYLPGFFEIWKALVGGESEQKAVALLSRIAEEVPVRILLPPLLKTLGEPCKNPSVPVALVDALASLVGAMDHAAVLGSHHEIVDYLLSALDGRRSNKLGCREYLRLECSLVSCFVSLVMKLSEASFRPVFLHLLDWSTKGSERKGDAIKVSVARGITLFHLVGKVSDKLRSILVPYFKHMTESCCEWLERKPSAGQAKKPRKGSKPKGSEDALALWTLKLEVVNSLKKCFTYDTVGFTDEDKLNEILPALLGSLGDAPPASTVAELESLAGSLLGKESGGDAVAMEVDQSTPDGLQTFSSLDLVARETADCLGKMAVAGNSDMAWKRINLKVLMATRTKDVRTKLVAVEVVSRLADFLREDYNVLIAETVPFISELLEDEEVAVQFAVKDFAKKLETISGEDLGQYLG